MARFTIKRQRPYNAADRYPWKLKDAERPYYLGQFASLRLALAAIDARMKLEREVERERLDNYLRWLQIAV